MSIPNTNPRQQTNLNGGVSIAEKVTRHSLYLGIREVQKSCYGALSRSDIAHQRKGATRMLNLKINLAGARPGLLVLEAMNTYDTSQSLFMAL